jgi:chemotaxis methyl-accepting protein methylase
MTGVTRHLERLGVGAFALYKAPCFERRVAVRLRASGQPDLAGYASLLDHDEAEGRLLLDALSIGVTNFFRNPTAWRKLGEHIDAVLPHRAFRAWSAGCATGEEAYSIAMLLAGTGRGGAGRDLGDWSVDASDLDEQGLAVARRGVYSGAVVGDIEAVGAPIGQVRDGEFAVSPELARRVRFERDDLTAARERGPYDLVVCRNVLIYFAEEGQRRVLRCLSDSLVPGGLLLLGRAELAAFVPEVPLTLVDSRERIYRRSE